MASVLSSLDPTTAKALQNFVGVATIYGSTKLPNVSKTPPKEWLRVLRTALASALTPLIHSLAEQQRLDPSGLVPALASAAPLRLLLDREMCNTLACHLVANILTGGAKRMTRYWHTVIFMVSCAQVICTWLFDPNAHPGPYRRFLDKAVGCAIPPQNRKILTECMSEGKPMNYALVLPGINLPHALIMFMLNHLTSFSIKFYAKLYIWRIVYALLTRRALPIKEVLKDTLRSAFFLSSLGLTGLLAVSGAGHLNRSMKVTKPMLFGILTLPGLTTLLESRDRQRMLPVYLLTFVLYSLMSKVPHLCDGALLGSLAAYTKLQPKPALLRALWAGA